MAGMSGVQLQDKLRADGVTLPVILISGYADVPTAVHTMRAGAVTFLEKPCREDELWSSICKAIEWHRRRREVRRRSEWLQSRFTQLTPGERDVMLAMVAGKPNKVIATELEIGLRTVELRRANILQKTGAGSLAELVRLAVVADRMAEAVA
jgi:two-component system, LuxR family, response regulator FixJ